MLINWLELPSGNDEGNRTFVGNPYGGSSNFLQIPWDSYLFKAGFGGRLGECSAKNKE